MTSWGGFVLRRAASLGLLLLVLILVTFVVVHLLPGNTAHIIAGGQATPQTVAHVRSEFGLGQSLSTQFLNYIKALAHLNFGTSFTSYQPVGSILAERTPVSLRLALYGLALTVVGGGLAGMTAAILTQHGKRVWLEHAFTGWTGITGAMPEYVTSTLLVALFAVTLRWLPVAGDTTIEAWILPSIAVAVRPAALFARIVRVETLEILEQDYMRTARSKRLTTTRLYVRHALPNVVGSTAATAGLIFASLIGGVVIVENVFALPGLGTALVQAVLQHDYPVIQGIVLYLGLAIVLTNLAVDVLASLVDRRSLARG